MHTPRHRIAQVLFWSVISAAFIGPGTLATASAAGAGYGLALVWALVFATGACILLQEAAARVMVASGISLAEAISLKYRGMVVPVRHLLAGSVVFGCAAYQAGNILGAVSGLQLLTGLDAWLLVCGVSGVAGFLLWYGNTRIIANTLGIAVAVMGVVFVAVATQSGVELGSLAKAVVVPQIPAGGEWVVLALVGTTIVPYNLFLGSGIGHGQSLGTMRFGLAIAILIGGAISIAILVAGTLVEDRLSFLALSGHLATVLGPWAGTVLGIGLFAAGLTSAITAPLAAAITVQGMFGVPVRQRRTKSTMGYRATWLGVLLVGFAMGIANFKAIPVIILAQAINGLLLPVVAVFIIMVVNDPTLMGKKYTNNLLGNLLLLGIVGIAILLGLNNLLKAVLRAFAIAAPSYTILYLAAMAGLFMVALGFQIWRQVKKGSSATTPKVDKNQ